MLRTHFYRPPSQQDLDDIGAVDAEIDADFLNEMATRTEIDIAPPGTAPQLLPGGVVFDRDATPERGD